MGGIIVEVSANKLSIPFVCACCGRPRPDAELVAAYTRTRGTRVVRETTRVFQFPCCGPCAAHVQRWHASASTRSRLLLVAAVVAIVVGGAAHDGAAGGVVFVIAAAIALLVAAQRRRAIIASCGPGCATVGPAVAYLGWAGTVKTFQFAARDYAVAFAQQNARNLINVSLELRRLLESANAPAAPLPQVTRERSAPAAQLVADPVLDWIARIESYKGAVARRNALGRALSELADPAARHQVLVAASKIEVAAVLDKVDRLSTAAAKRRHLERAIAELAADRIPAELQAAELLLLEARLRALGDRA